MVSKFVNWTLHVGLVGVLLLALPLLSLPMIDTSVLHAAEPLDINTATADQLKALHGIGYAKSRKIIEGRPYTRKDELVQKKVIPQTTYDKIKDQIVAKEK